MKIRMQETNNINFTQIRNWWPILTGSIIVAAAFFSVKTDIAVQTEKIEQMAEAQRGYLLKSDNSEVKLNNHETRISILENNKQSYNLIPSKIVSVQPSPTVEIKKKVEETKIVKQKVTIEEDKKPEQTPEPSPIMKLINPILGLLGGN